MNDTTKTRIWVRKIEKADEPVYECSCCGKMHRKIHHMSNGAIMGSQCAAMVQLLSGFVDDLNTWAKDDWSRAGRVRDLNDPTNAIQVAYLRARGAAW